MTDKKQLIKQKRLKHLDEAKYPINVLYLTCTYSTEILSNYFVLSHCNLCSFTMCHVLPMEAGAGGGGNHSGSVNSLGLN